MKIVDTLPTSGQFVMVHLFEGKMWGETYRHNEGKLEFLDSTTDLVDQEVDGEMITVAIPNQDWVEVADFDEMHGDVSILGYIVEGE